ncbi:hypothetical protein JZM63_18885 [Aeromonas caviae]|nr:hypothetical protein JZM63_18885 [Aeromonas caviae]
MQYKTKNTTKNKNNTPKALILNDLTIYELCHGEHNRSDPLRQALIHQGLFLPVSDAFTSPDDHVAAVIPQFFGALKSRGHAACAKRCFGV